MLAISFTASISTHPLAQMPLDDASMEEQLRFFEFLSQSVVKDSEVITPVDLVNEEHQTVTSNTDNINQTEKQNDISSSHAEEVVQ